MGKLEEQKARNLFIKDTFFKYLKTNEQIARLEDFEKKYGKGAPNSEQRYINHLIDTAVDVPAAFAALSAFDSKKEDEKLSSINDWIKKDKEAKKRALEATGVVLTKKKTKKQIAAEAELQKKALEENEEYQKKFLHLENDLKTLINRFNKYALIYATSEIDEFKTKLTNFQTGIDAKIIELENNRKEAKAKQLQKEIDDAAELLKTKKAELEALKTDKK